VKIAAFVCTILCVLLTFPQAADAQPNDPDKPWRISVSAGTGWNSNVAAIGHTIGNGTPASAVPFIRDKGSALGRLTFDGSYDLLADNDQILTIGYGLHTDIYEGDAEEISSHQHEFWVGYQRKLADNFSVSLQVADRYIFVGNNSFSNSILIEPSFYYKIIDGISLEGRYTAGYVDHFNPAIAPGFNRDGDYHEISVMTYFDIPKTPARVRLGYARRWTFTEANNGGQYEYTSDRLTVGLNTPLIFEITLDISFTRSWDNYNGIAVGGPNFRDDVVNYYSLGLMRPIAQNARIYVRYDHIDAESNGTLFEYRQNVVAVGVIWDF